MILHICANQIDRYNFKVYDTVTEQMYADTGIDMTTVTAAKLVFTDKKTGSNYEIDIFSDWQYILSDGLTININDFPDNKMGDYDYFPDWVYDITVVYTYGGNEYSSKKCIGFRAIISNIVYQQLQQSSWVQEMKCGCGCKKYATSFRKFDFLGMLKVASENCLINEYIEILQSLYKLTATTHEYS